MRGIDGEFVDIRYWKEVTEEIGSIAVEDWNILLLTHDSLEIKEIMKFFTELPSAKRIVYISLTRTCSHIRPYFKEPYFGKDSRVFVIDCVSLGVFKDKVHKKSGDCIFVHPPSSMEKMQELIGKSLEKIKPQYIILDSLSQLIEFLSSQGEGMFNFFYYLRNRHSGCRFILLYDNSHASKDVPNAYVDIILKIERERSLVTWQD
ncbi:MAG: hypothetical protein ACLFO6_00780 [Archaeoglobaceae archaeon]